LSRRRLWVSDSQCRRTGRICRPPLSAGTVGRTTCPAARLACRLTTATEEGRTRWSSTGRRKMSCPPAPRGIPLSSAGRVVPSACRIFRTIGRTTLRPCSYTWWAISWAAERDRPPGMPNLAEACCPATEIRQTGRCHRRRHRSL